MGRPSSGRYLVGRVGEGPESWIGFFPEGDIPGTSVLSIGERILVLASGYAWLVDPRDASASSGLDDLYPVIGARSYERGVLVWSWSSMTRVTAVSIAWTRHLCLDGLEILRIEEGLVLCRGEFPNVAMFVVSESDGSIVLGPAHSPFEEKRFLAAFGGEPPAT